jgi:hypothetical protein
MARPPKDPAERKSLDLRISVTQEQKSRITEAASLDGVDMAEWARALLLKAADQRLKKEARGGG